MKKFISISPNFLSFSITEKVTGTVKVEGEADRTETKDVTKDIVMSQGTVLDLPEENPYVKDLIIKKLIEEYKEPAPEPNKDAGDNKAGNKKP
jgi:hypothetical protein